MLQQRLAVLFCTTHCLALSQVLQQPHPSTPAEAAQASLTGRGHHHVHGGAQAHNVVAQRGAARGHHHLHLGEAGCGWVFRVR